MIEKYLKYTSAILGAALLINGIVNLRSPQPGVSPAMPWIFIGIGLLSIAVSVLRFIKKW